MAEEMQDSLNSKRKAVTFYGWKYSHYFQIVEEGDKNCGHVVLCAVHARNLCRVLYTLHLTLKKHLEIVHKLTKLVAKEPKKSTAESANAGKCWIDTDEPNQPKRQCTLLSKSTVSPTRLRTLISEYIIEDMLPLSTVESQAFRRLIGGISSAQVPDRKSITLHLRRLGV